MTLSHILPYVVTASDTGAEQNNGDRTQHIEIHYHFDVAVTTAAADSMKCDNKRKVA